MKNLKFIVLGSNLMYHLFVFFLLIYFLKDNCFTEFCCCQTSTGISHRYIYIPHLLKLSSPLPMSISLFSMSVYS